MGAYVVFEYENWHEFVSEILVPVLIGLCILLPLRMATVRRTRGHRMRGGPPHDEFSASQRPL